MVVDGQSRTMRNGSIFMLAVAASFLFLQVAGRPPTDCVDGDCQVDLQYEDPVVIRTGKCAASWGKIEGLAQSCYNDPRLFGTVAIKHGETPAEGYFEGIVGLLQNEWSCDNLQRTGSVTVTVENGMASVKVTPDSGKVLHSFGVYFSEENFFPEEIRSLKGYFKSFPDDGVKGEKQLNFGNICNDNLKYFNYWILGAVICDEGSTDPPPIEPKYYCRESFGRFEGLSAVCFDDRTLFPGAGWSNGQLPTQGSFTGVMETFPEHGNCKDGETTANVELNIDCGIAEFIVTPIEGRKIYSLEVKTANHELTATELIRYNGKFKSIPDGSSNSHWISYGHCINSEFVEYLSWSIHALICDNTANLPPPVC